jgi:hypothetical protein
VVLVQSSSRASASSSVILAMMFSYRSTRERQSLRRFIA